MNIFELLLIILGLAVIAGGVVMLLRGAKEETSGNNVSRPYLTLGIIAVGIVIIYHTISDYVTMSGVEIAGLFLFGLAFSAALALKIFVVDRFDFNAGHIEPESKETGAPQSSDDKEAGGTAS